MMAQGNGRNKHGSTLTEMFRLAGDLVEDGIDMMMGTNKPEYKANEWDNSSDDGTGTTGEGGMRELRNEFTRSKDDDDYSYIAYSSEEERQERVRQIRQRDLDNMRRAKDVGGDRELELKQKLSQFEEEFLADVHKQEAVPDFTFIGPTTATTSEPERKQAAVKTFQVLLGGSNVSEGDTAQDTEDSPEASTEYTGESTEETEADEDEEDEFASQIVHEMMQLLHHSRKNRNEAERLIEYKRIFIRERHETSPDLDAHIVKNANYKKLECSTRRFIRHLKDGDVPQTEQALNMKRELMQNIAAMRDIRRESAELDMEFESMLDAAE